MLEINTKSVSKKPSLSLCMIVKNEAAHLNACLGDVQPVVDEMIVVDTGSTDQTVSIARNCGANVFQFDWIDDFAAARNESIRHASGDYILWMDADDRLEPESRQALIDFKQGLDKGAKEAYALLIACRNVFGEAAIYYQVRIFPNVKGACFEGKVHENLIPALGRLGIAIKNVDVQIVHTGYNDDISVQHKVRRNLRILLKAAKEKELTPLENYYLAKCYFGIRDYQRCLEFLDKARKRGRQASFYKHSYTMLADCHLQLSRGSEAVTILRQAVGEFPTSGYLHYLLGASLTMTGGYEEALSCLEKADHLTIEVEDSPVLANIEGRLFYYYGRCMEGYGRAEAACNAYQRALEAAPYDLDILRAYGFVLTKQGRLENARQIFQRARKRASKVEVDIWLALASICLFLKEPNEARRLYLEVLEADPSNQDAAKGLTRTKELSVEE